MIEGAVQALRRRTTSAPEVAVILGTGLGALAEEIDVETTVSYEDIPSFPLSTVESHVGRLLFGTLEGVPVVAMQGRFHRYEGYTMQQLVLPVRVMQRLGARALVVSNACGNMNPEWKPGELMLIADHINFMGDNPLIGPNDDAVGPRFPDMSEPYSERLREMAREVARKGGITLREGVYVAVPGPNLETRAEYRMLQRLGADVVGMSTIPEVIVAVHGGMEVLGLSIMTDQCLPDSLKPATVEEIIRTAQGAEPALSVVVKGVMARFAA